MFSIYILTIYSSIIFLGIKSVFVKKLQFSFMAAAVTAAAAENQTEAKVMAHSIETVFFFKGFFLFKPIN